MNSSSEMKSTRKHQQRQIKVHNHGWLAIPSLAGITHCQGNNLRHKPRQVTVARRDVHADR